MTERSCRRTVKLLSAAIAHTVPSGIVGNASVLSGTEYSGTPKILRLTGFDTSPGVCASNGSLDTISLVAWKRLICDSCSTVEKLAANPVTTEPYCSTWLIAWSAQ
jgi:hypothetical protein